METPPLRELGTTLLDLPAWRRTLTLTVPFAWTALFFVAASRGWWPVALFCAMALSFVTYGSVSHDLVHRTLHLPEAVNDVLLCAVELIVLRSGHAYQFTHLHHHAHYPSADDIEARCAGKPWWRAAVEGPIHQPRLYWFALTHARRKRAWMIGEGIAAAALACAAVAAIRWTIAPAVYAALVIMGSWVFPFVTVYLPHDPAGKTELTQTRVFRGKVLSVVALDHLYHLEHHLYPQVPHHNWPALARRLDPYFEREGIRPIRLLW